MPNAAAKPVQTLQDHTRALEAAITVALASPTKGAVHKLRTQTRRIEAQLLLLHRLHGLPPHRKEAAALRHELKKLRRAAGTARDLDVHADHLAALDGHEGVDKLQAALTDDRRAAAEALTKLLRARQAKLATALEALHKALKPSLAFAMPITELLAEADRFFRRAVAGRHRFSKLSEDELHTLRKAAKVSRYLAESAPRSQHARAAASRYEALQDQGGRWHDGLALAALAKSQLGRHHPLTAQLRALRKRHHTIFLEALQHFTAELAPPAKT